MQNLAKLREKIDKTDQKIAQLLEKRLEIVKEIGKHKAKLGIKIADKKREKEVLSKMDMEYKKNIFKCIIEESKKAQQQVDQEV